MSVLDKYYASGDVVLDFHPATGSLKDLSGSGNHPTTITASTGHRPPLRGDGLMPGIVRRARRNFSTPYPAQSAEEHLGPELVVDPSNPASWSASGSFTISQVANTSPSPDESALRIDFTGGGATTNNTGTLVVGRRYRIRAWIRSTTTMRLVAGTSTAYTGSTGGVWVPVDVFDDCLLTTSLAITMLGVAGWCEIADLSYKEVQTLVDVDCGHAVNGELVNHAAYPNGVISRLCDIVRSRGPWSGGIDVVGNAANVASPAMGNDAKSTGTMIVCASRLGNTSVSARVFRVGSVGGGAVGWMIQCNTGTGTIRYDAGPANGNATKTGVFPPTPHVPFHVAVTHTGTTAILYINGTAVPWTADAITGPPEIPANAEWGLNRYFPTNQDVNSEVYSARATSKVLTPAEVRQEYLKGARKLLVDASMFADGSCPVSIAGQTDGTLGGPGGWEIRGGTWQIGEDAPPAPGVPGDRGMERAAGTAEVVTRDPAAYGSWYGRFDFQSLSTATAEWSLVATTLDGAFSTVLGNMYFIQYRHTTPALILYQGVVVVSSIALAGLMTDQAEFWVARKYDGQFTVWVRGGGLYSDWTQVMQGTNTTLTTSAGQRLRFGSNTPKLYECRHYLGEMNPLEAFEEGLVDDSPVIGDPFMECTTTDTTQSWTIAMTAGARYVFDWGDGTLDIIHSTGANQNITHNYGGAGTYSIRLWIDDPTALTYFNCSGNSLSGTLPSFATCTNLVTFYCHTNSFSGTLPSFAACTSLVYFYCHENAFTSYATGAWATTCTFCRLDDNALDQAAVDAVLAEFATGVAGRPAAGTIELDLGTNSPPSAAGLASKAAILAAKPGWTINNN